MAEMEKMSSSKQIKQKFACLVQCSLKIFEAIHVSTGSEGNADEFMPVLIYVILKSNPTLICSNLNFINRFSVDFRTYYGQTGYCFANLCSAVSFIQEMNAKSLRMSTDVFEEFVSFYSNA
jgi:hypothetical protein